jgi:YbbR domain-containing protein
MKKKILHNWQAKLGSFVIALVLWFMFKSYIEPDLMQEMFHPTQQAP